MSTIKDSLLRQLYPGSMTMLDKYMSDKDVVGYPIEYLIQFFEQEYDIWISFEAEYGYRKGCVSWKVGDKYTKMYHNHNAIWGILDETWMIAFEQAEYVQNKRNQLKKNIYDPNEELPMIM